MKRIFYLALVIIPLCVFPFKTAISSDDVSVDDINVEPIPDEPGYYSVNIKFNTIESVTVSTTIIAESLGIKHENFNLQKSEWSYDSSKEYALCRKETLITRII